MIRATESYVRVIVRRPHAYQFLQDYLPDLERLSRAPAVANGENEPILIMQSPDAAPLVGEITLPDGSTVDASEIVVIDASKIPIPGLVTLDSDGSVLGNISFLQGGSRTELLDFLREHTE